MFRDSLFRIFQTLTLFSVIKCWLEDCTEKICTPSKYCVGSLFAFRIVLVLCDTD